MDGRKEGRMVALLLYIPSQLRWRGDNIDSSEKVLVFPNLISIVPFHSSCASSLWVDIFLNNTKISSESLLAYLSKFKLKYFDTSYTKSYTFEIKRDWYKRQKTNGQHTRYKNR